MQQFNWKNCVGNFTPEQTRELASERGVSELTIEGLRTRELIGSCWVPKWNAQCIAFPIYDPAAPGDVYRAHCRSPERNAKGKFDWRYEPWDPKGKPVPALVFGDPGTASRASIFESQWDAITLIDKLDMFAGIDSGEMCLIVTRGADGCDRLNAFEWLDANPTYAFPQNDDAGQEWLASVLEATGGARVVKTPQAYKDLGEWVKNSGAEAADLEYALDHADFEREADSPEEKTFKPTGGSPVGYSKKGITEDDVLLGNGFLEREGAALLAGPSGIGKSSIAMQMGCCWACGKAAFYFEPPRNLRVVMMQHEDSQNDLVRQSAIVDWLGLDKDLIEQNFWIETVRGQIGSDAVKIMVELVKWRRADVLILNPLTAYHDGDISQNKDNVKFLYSEIGKLLSELRIGLFAFHHKGKPPRRNAGNNGKDDVYHEIMYEVLGGSVLTNFFRGIITVSPIPNSSVYKFTVAKRFEQSGWPVSTQQFRWHDDKTKRLWVPASVTETETARQGSAKTLDDLYQLTPVLGSIPKNTFEMTAMEKRFTRRDYRGLLAQALDDSTPDNVRLYQWSIYNPSGLAKASYSRLPQPASETHRAIKDTKNQERKRKKPRKPAKT